MRPQLGSLARAIYTNKVETKGELFFKKGDILTVLEVDFDGQIGWWLCALRGQRGICPSNYLEPIEDKYSLPIKSPKVPTTDSPALDDSRIPDPLETYDVPRSFKPPESNHLQTLESSTSSILVGEEDYDVPRTCPEVTSSLPELPVSSSSSTEEIVETRRNKGWNSTLVLTHTRGDRSSAFSSLSTSSSGSSSANSGAPAEASNTNKSNNINNQSGKPEESPLYENSVQLRRDREMLLAQEASTSLYDVPRSSIVSLNDDRRWTSSKDSLEEAIGSGGTPCNSVKGYVRSLEKRLETEKTPPERRFGRIFENSSSKAPKRSTLIKSASISDPSEIYDIPRSSQELRMTQRTHPQEPETEDYDVPSSYTRKVPLTDSTETLSFTPRRNSEDSLNFRGYSAASLSRIASKSSLRTSYIPDYEPLSPRGHPMALPFSPKAAVSICEKLRQEVVTSVKGLIQLQTGERWRSKENLIQIMPELRFGAIRLNLACRDFYEFCTKAGLNAKRYGSEQLSIKFQRLLHPLANGSQIIQRDVDELEAYFWSIERLALTFENGRSSNNGNRKANTLGRQSFSAGGDALEQLMFVARSLQHDSTEMANFIGLNSTTLFKDEDPIPAQMISISSSISQIPEQIADDPQEPDDLDEYDYVTLTSDEEKGRSSSGASIQGSVSSPAPPPSLPPSSSRPVSIVSINNPKLVDPRDRQLLEFYSGGISDTAPLLSESISSFISSIHQNDPPRVFNCHLKFVILLAYKMLFIGDTLHQNLRTEQMRKEIEVKANDLHNSIVTLHEASRQATKEFPRILPMQAIVDRIWEATASANQLKKVILNYWTEL